MTKVTLINTGEGQRNILDVNNRPHSFPCGMIADIDLHPTHIQMLTNANKSKLVVVPDGVVLEPEFTDMMTVLHQLSERDYATNLAEVRRVLGKDAMRQRPELAEMRARLQRIATKYAVAGFTNFATIANLEGKDGDDLEKIDHNAAAVNAHRDMSRRETKLNVPRHMLAQMQEMEDRRNMVEDDAPSKDARVTSADGKRERLGRVPPPQPSGVSTVPLSEMPTAKPGELPKGSSPSETIQQIEERNKHGDNPPITDVDDNTPDLMPEYDQAGDDEGDEDAPRAPRKRVAKKTATKPAGRAKKAAKKTVAKKAAKKAGSRR